MEAFPQAQKYIPSYQDGGQGGDQQQILMQYLQAFAQLQGMPIEQLMQALQQMPEEQQSQAIQQIVQMVDQVMSQQGQGQGQPQGMDMAQSGEMPMDPNQAVQMALGGAYNLKKFTDPYPAAAELPDSPIYRTMPPNMPRLFAYGGMYQTPTDDKSNETSEPPEWAPVSQECGFGHYFDTSTGNCVPYKWYTASKIFAGSAGAIGTGYGLYKGIPYAMERKAVEPGRRPIRGFNEGQNFIMEDLEKQKIGDKVKNWSYFGESINEPITERRYMYNKLDPKTKQPTGKTTGWTSKYYNIKEGKAKNLELADYKDVETGTNKYLKHSDYGNAKWVEENLKHLGITPEEWAKMGQTEAGKINQREIVMSLRHPNYAAMRAGIAQGMLKFRKASPLVKGSALTLLLAGVIAGGYGVYDWATSPEETEMQNQIPQTPSEQTPENQQRELYLGTHDSTTSIPPPSRIFQFSGPINQMGGSSSPMGYGMFPAIMREGGSFSNAAPNIYDTDGYLNNYNDNEFKRYIQQNIDNSIYERGLKAASFPTMDQMRPMQMQARRGGSSKKKILDKYAVDGETNPWSSVWNNPVNPFAGSSYYIDPEKEGEKRYIETDPNQSINTLTGQEDEPTTGSAAPNAPQGPTITLDPNQNPSKNIYDNQFDPNKEKAEEAMRVGQNMTQKCPKGQKWDPVRQECYREKYVSNQAKANAIITGLNAAGMLADRFSGNKRREENTQIIGSLADSVMPKKDYNGVDFYGYEDVNTFTPNPRYGTYNRSVYQPPGSEYMADGGEVQYLTKKQINDLLAKGGQIEFL